MESIFAGGIAIWILGIALLISPLMIWYHVGHVSRKLSRVIELLEQNRNVSQNGMSSNVLTPRQNNKPRPMSVKEGLIVVGVIFIIGLVYLVLAFRFHW